MNSQKSKTLSLNENVSWFYLNCIRIFLHLKKCSLFKLADRQNLFVSKLVSNIPTQKAFNRYYFTLE